MNYQFNGIPFGNRWSNLNIFVMQMPDNFIIFHLRIIKLSRVVECKNANI